MLVKKDVLGNSGSSFIIHVSLLAFFVAVILNLPVLYRQTPASVSGAVVAILSAVGLFCLTFFLLFLSRLFGSLFYRLFASFIVLCSGAAAFYMFAHRVVIGYGVIVSVLTMDTDLHAEQFGVRFIIWMLILGVLPIFWIWRSKAPSYKQHVKQYGILLLALLFGLIAFKLLDKFERSQAQQDNSFSPSPSGRIAHTYVPSNWLSALGLFAYEKARSGDDKLLDPAQIFNYQLSNIEDTYVVFVIGETTRADHMGVLGYERDTTPNLSKEPNLIALRGVSCDTATKLSLRCMFVRPEGVSSNEQRTLSERNVFSVLRSLGVSSELFAMQSEVWFYQSTHPNDYKIREMIAAEIKSETNQTLDDSVLLGQLRDSVKRHQQGKHLIILHTKGSHYLYSQRYPRSYAKFTPECFSVDGECTKEEFINAFDNSVLFIDDFLKKTFDEFRNKKAIVFFVSDHGESLSDNMHFHATPRIKAPAEQFRVPYLVWMSDGFRQASSENQQAFLRLKSLQEHKAIVSHQTLYDSILGCLGVRSNSDQGINAHHNICGSGFVVDPNINILPGDRGLIYP